MSIFEKSRYKIFSRLQHLYRHDVSEFAYSHQALPSTVNSIEDAMDYIISVLYPKNKASVATPGDLPTGIDTPNIGDVTPEVNDFRLVNDDGDGNASGYMFVQYDGEANASWHKVYDFDWGINGVIQGLVDKTQPLYMMKRGFTDYDETTELEIVGDLAGQSLYGGEKAGQNLTLFATNGDVVGNSGYVQFGDDVRPLDDNAFILGDATHRFSDFHTTLASIANLGFSGSTVTSTTGAVSFDDDNISTTGNIDGAILTGSTSVVVDNGANSLTVSVGSITDTTGAISFGNENLSTTGTLASGTHTIGTLVLGAGSITDTSGTIDYDDENLQTTGSVTAGVGSFGQLDVDNVRVDGNTISILDLNVSLNLIANGLGVVDIQSAMTTIGQTITGIVDITGQLDIDLLTLNGNDINSVTNIIDFNSTLLADGDGTRDLGGANRWRDLYISSNIRDNTNLFPISDLMELRATNFRDAAKTTPAVTGDVLFYDSVLDLWLASSPDTEIDHGAISGLGDDDHTQYALLGGRAAGQILIGGTSTTEIFSLRNNTADNDGLNLDVNNVYPTGNGTYDLGKTGNNFHDIYMLGEGLGFRAENILDADFVTIGAAGKEGRLAYATDSNFVGVDIGGSYVKLNNKGYNQLKTQAQLLVAITVSSEVDDARNCIWQLCDVTNNEEVMSVVIEKTETQVTINNEVALPAGNYRLIGLQVN